MENPKELNQAKFAFPKNKNTFPENIKNVKKPILHQTLN